ncbi:MAG TPA: Nif3-like dinuclear metal center hexameric protein [Gemmatimonadales bacterium]|nr:Nif3-like dinuclear metal center hexameric protein [Gemmatimonadales bacterium]
MSGSRGGTAANRTADGDAGVALAEIAGYLDGYLRVDEVPDSPNALNGLQVENGGRVARIVAAVDASLEAIEGAENATGPTLLIVHHGLFWNGSIPLTGRRLRRVRALLERDMALYSAHIPLDVHPDVGNNVVLASQLGIGIEGWWGEHGGIPIGVWGRPPAALDDRDRLVAELNRLLGTSARLIPGGPQRTARVGVLTGAGGSAIAEARDAGLDTLVTGEGAHHTYFDAMELGVNAVYAGHYATEQVGVQALAQHLSDRFGLPWEFHRHPTGL